MDPDILDDIRNIAFLLNHHLQYLLDQRDFEALAKLLPAVKLLNGLIVAMSCRTDLTLEKTIAPLEKAAAELFDSLLCELDQLSNQTKQMKH
jgi:hypothetical protein